MAVKSHPVAALGCPQWTSLPHWLAFQAAASRLQNRFRKDFLPSVSCAVTRLPSSAGPTVSPLWLET